MKENALVYLTLKYLFFHLYNSKPCVLVQPDQVRFSGSMQASSKSYNERGVFSPFFREIKYYLE